MIAPDSSVTIAAAAPWHVAHEAAVAALAAEEASLIAHVAFETTVALSRMPQGQRIAPSVVLEWLQLRFGGRWLALPGAATRRALRTAVDQGIRGGALYDALIAATALHHGHTLISADRRAAPIYSALGGPRRLRRRGLRAARARALAARLLLRRRGGAASAANRSQQRRSKPARAWISRSPVDA